MIVCQFVVVVEIILPPPAHSNEPIVTKNNTVEDCNDPPGREMDVTTQRKMMDSSASR